MGGKSQFNGVLFETLFMRLCRLKGVSVTRIPDGCRQTRRGLLRVKTPWDFVLTYQKKTALIDTKSINDDVFPCSLIVDHQVHSLFEHERNGAIAGYVIWLRLSDRVFFIPAFALLNASKERGSFSDTHPSAIFLGPMNFDIRKIFEVSIQH